METCTGPGSFTRAAGGQGFGRPSWADVAWGAAGSPGCRRSWGRRGLGLGRSRLGGARDGTHRLPRTGQGLARGYAAGVPAGQSPPQSQSRGGAGLAGAGSDGRQSRAVGVRPEGPGGRREKGAAPAASLRPSVTYARFSGSNHRTWPRCLNMQRIRHLRRWIGRKCPISI